MKLNKKTIGTLLFMAFPVLLASGSVAFIITKNIENKVEVSK